MKNNFMLTIASLLSILMMTFHLTQDTLHASYARAGTFEARGSALIVGVPILVSWLWGTLLLAERRSGYIIMLVGSVIALGMPVIHVIFGMGTGKPCPKRVRENRVGLLLCLDALRARHDRPVLAHSRGARVAEPAIGPVAVVEELETWNGGWLC